MNYELAKKLEEAGFLVKNRCGCEQPCIHQNYPTLSELIEACGDKFDNLTRWIGSDTLLSKGWVTNYRDDEVTFDSFGKTPEEAVANLWLELNK